MRFGPCGRSSDQRATPHLCWSSDKKLENFDPEIWILDESRVTESRVHKVDNNGWLLTFIYPSGQFACVEHLEEL